MVTSKLSDIAQLSEGDTYVKVAKRLFPRLHTWFGYNFLMNGPNLTIFGM